MTTKIVKEREMLKDKNKSIVIHYACESFVTTHGRTPRVTSICMRYLGTAQTKSFSIYLQAQFEQKDFNNLSVADYRGFRLVLNLCGISRITLNFRNRISHYS
jgi:hypothetical protein